MAKRTVAVFGSGRVRQGEESYKLAYDLGKRLAQAGFAVANGGYGGTMLAAAKGAAEAGGETTGVTCSAFPASKANQFIAREISTSSLDERLDTLVNLGDAYVVLPGGTGTLLEFAKVWELKNKAFLNKRKPIILVGDFWKPVAELVARDDPGSAALVMQALDAEQTVEILKRSTLG